MEIRGIVTTTVLILALIAISTTTAAATNCTCGDTCDICVNRIGWWYCDGTFNVNAMTPIQAAVDAAGSGDTICVAAGSYPENVDINTSHLTLAGAGVDDVTVTALNSGDHVFGVTADYVNISGFTTTGATVYSIAGIALNGADHCNISENDASGNYYGIMLYSSSNNTLTSNTASDNDYGIYLYDSSNNTLTSNTASYNDYGGIDLDCSSDNTLTSNTASYNDYGIYLYDSSNNTLTSNTASDNYYGGIELDYSSNNTLTSNTASYNDYGIELEDSSNNTLTSNTASYNNDIGIELDDSSNNTLTSNNASDNDYGIMLDYSSNNALTSNTADSNGDYGIYLFHSSDNTLTSNTASYTNDIGIALVYSSDNTVTNNTASDNCYGIAMDYSSDNTLTNNTASDNYYGIYLYDSSNNLVYNNYFNNTHNAYDDGTNTWNITKATGPNIINGRFLGGNYWSDYAGNDTDWDGLGNTLLPYNSSGVIQNGGDYHPLVPCADTTSPVINITRPGPYGLYTVGMTLGFSATDDESGVDTVVGNLTNTSEVSRHVVGNSSFAPPVGVYTLVVTATDNCSNTNVSDPVFFVVYDPSGGHATGGGWFYPDENSTLPDGKANFGFIAKYKDASSTGKLNFQYKDAGIHLKSTSIDWLTISSVSAQFQGTGTINGDGLYTFRVKAKDNGEPGADTDHFDIKIWNGTDTEADPYHKAKNTISGGNIQVQT